MRDIPELRRLHKSEIESWLDYFNSPQYLSQNPPSSCSEHALRCALFELGYLKEAVEKE